MIGDKLPRPQSLPISSDMAGNISARRKEEDAAQIVYLTAHTTLMNALAGHAEIY
jgi:hypothetical protein